MAFSLSHTIAGTTATSTALAYMFDTFIPNYGWTTSAHPNGSSNYRSLSRSYTNLLTGNTITNYHWTTFSHQWYYLMYEDATYTTVPGDLGTDNSSTVTSYYEATAYSGLDWKFWTSSEKSKASLVTRGKFVVWFDPGVTDVFAYEDPGWTGAADSGTTHFFPWNYSHSSFMMANAPSNSGSHSAEYFIQPNHEGGSYQPAVDSIIKGFDYSYTTQTGLLSGGPAYRITGNDIVLHVPAAGGQSNKDIGGAGVVVQVGSDYYFRFSATMTQVAPMLYMGTSEPDFS